MYRAVGVATEYNCLEDGQRCLPQMTALFVDGLSGQLANSSRKASHPDKYYRSLIDPQRFSVPLSSLSRQQISKTEITSFCARIEKPSCSSRKGRPDADLEKLRSFIYGISNCFNNILMGIWGNISLLSMTVDKRDPVRSQVQNIDRLIQNGAMLIHSLFGYMAERRVATKHLRLVQLVHEINEGAEDPEAVINLQQIEKGMELASKITRPSVVAEGMAGVLDQLLSWIQGQLMVAKEVANEDLNVLKRINTIDLLLSKGAAIVRQLELYAGCEKPKKRHMSVRSLVKEQVRISRKNYKEIAVSSDVSDNLRMLSADRGHLQFVLEQLIANAASAMPNGGKLKIAARPINEEAPEERCVVNPACDYTVITVSDNGVGMSLRTQTKIFTPFYAKDRKSNPVGLGLAASSSIIKRHGGYIQVKSEKKRGSTFKIYLPTKMMAFISAFSNAAVQ